MRIEREDIQGVHDAIAVVVRVFQVAHAVAIRIEPIAAVFRQVVHRVHEAVSVRIGISFLKRRGLKAHRIEAGHRVRAGNGVPVLAAGPVGFLIAAAGGIRVREDIQAAAAPSIAHDRGEVVLDVMAAGPAPGSDSILIKRVTQSQGMPQLVGERVGAAHPHYG